MPDGFVIMKFGDAQLDQVFEDVICPALTAAGLTPRRVDRDDEGELLKSEIVAFLEQSEIIVADLTGVRPNCYLEVGYAMGLGKKTNLIMTVREDHHHSSPNYVHGGPRVHFDLEGYSLIFWNPEDLPGFRAQLEAKINRRLAILHDNQPAVSSTGALVPTLDTDWLPELRQLALQEFSDGAFLGYWEAVSVVAPKGNWTVTELREAVAASQIDTFGWPIGVFYDQDPDRALPTAGGIRAVVNFNHQRTRSDWVHLDVWSLRKTGDFYMLRDYFEDTRIQPSVIFFNTRIVQVTELLLFLSRLYSRLNLGELATVRIQLTHAKLRGREISAIGNRGPSMRPGRHAAIEESVVTELTTTVLGLADNLPEIVQALLDPLFELFDYFRPGPAIYQNIIERFLRGEVS
jgi:hypothetical protein